MDTPSRITSPAALVCVALSELLTSVMPDECDFVLMIRHGSGDTAIETYGFTAEEGRAFVAEAVSQMQAAPIPNPGGE